MPARLGAAPPPPQPTLQDLIDSQPLLADIIIR
jgi:hypothetical protein